MRRFRSHGAICAFTLVELIVVVTIIVFLATLATPVAYRGTRLFQLVQCVQQSKQLGRATIQFFNENPSARTFDVAEEEWMRRLEPYGFSGGRWRCPASGRFGEGNETQSDYMYAGATGEVMSEGDRLGEVYLWVEKFPYHDGLHVCVMADGRVRTENLTVVESP